MYFWTLSVWVRLSTAHIATYTYVHICRSVHEIVAQLTETLIVVLILMNYCLKVITPHLYQCAGILCTCSAVPLTAYHKLYHSKLVVFLQVFQFLVYYRQLNNAFLDYVHTTLTNITFIINYSTWLVKLFTNLHHSFALRMSWIMSHKRKSLHSFCIYCLQHFALQLWR
jgi:hypothetical protein